MDFPRFGIIASPSTIMLASVARSQRWITDDAQFPLVLVAVVLGIGSFIAFTAQRSRGNSAPSHEAHDDHAWPCVACGYDVRHKPERCPECGTLVPPHRRPLDPQKLRDDWPAAPIDPRKPSDAETLVRAWDAPNGYAAALLVEQLRARGIKATVRTRLPAMQIGEYQTPSADHAVFVWSDDTTLTSAILQRLAYDDDASTSRNVNG